MRLATRRRFLLIGLSLLLPLPFTRAEDRRNAFEALRGTKLFAFGGIGGAGTISQGELDFRAVLTSPTAEADFTKLLKSGTPEAQCYALVGLRQKNRAAYETEVKAFASSRKEVQTCAGCIMAKLPMASVVAGIERGNYDQRVKMEPPARK